ncbi:MAG: hypothetical protein F4205_01605 [Gemmatimonadetes bacterium]|nr:hypothetical protein [Gemmatimonadota bacterium]MYG34163.1 hypothetical protein [Gemmatimonadota bacterium]
MRRILDLINEPGTIDEMGLATLRDGLSEALFPGTSTIQTRLRYVLFVPWIYRRLEAAKTSSADVAVAGRRAETALIHPLRDSSEDGIIGARAGASLARLPSSVYWYALVRWGVFQHDRSRAWYHSNLGRLARQRLSVAAAADDPGVMDLHRPSWHPRLPTPPDGFPAGISFALTHEEADFVEGRIEERCAGTLLAHLAAAVGQVVEGPPWVQPAARNVSPEVRELVELARRFSLHVEGVPLLYNLLLAERRHDLHGSDEDEAWIDSYQGRISKWTEDEAEESAFNPDRLWIFAARHGVHVPRKQRRFVESWSARIGEIVGAAHGGSGRVADDPQLRSLVADRERELKGRRSRFDDMARLMDWNGAAGVGRMDFRWRRVRVLLDDLHRGLVA